MYPPQKLQRYYLLREWSTHKILHIQRELDPISAQVLQVFFFVNQLRQSLPVTSSWNLVLENHFHDQHTPHYGEQPF